MLEFKNYVTVVNEINIYMKKLNTFCFNLWMNCWMIMTDMQISDKLFFIKYDCNVLLNQVKQFRSNKECFFESLFCWKQTVQNLKYYAQIQYKQDTLLIYFCSLNHNDKHFSLLEINKPEKKIYHYDSKTMTEIINSTVKLTWVNQIIKISSDAQLRY